MNFISRTLAGKTAIVTGGGQGLGLGIAQALAAAGANVVITGRDDDKLQRAAQEIRSQQRDAEIVTVQGDVRQRVAAVTTVARAAEMFGTVDILVNNAQSSIPGVPLEHVDDDTIGLTIESGLLGTLYFMQAAFPQLKARGGSIINLGSRNGVIGEAGFSIYAATKEGIRGLSRVAAREWGRHHIRVNVINPAASTPASVKYGADHPDRMREILSTIALGRLGDPVDDLGRVAVFLAGEESRYVTGQTINADGGQVML
jgi:NAD(P)-dependent dehydrogenase (short-subunit alcohol dehydrogenase family)